MLGEIKSGRQFSRRNLFTANFRSPYSALFDRLNPPYSANAQVLAPEFETILPSAGPWNLRSQWSIGPYVVLPTAGAE
jgi:hypothetical protein